MRLQKIVGLNRKAVFSEFMEMVLVLAGFIIVILLSIIFVGMAQIDVEGEVEAENARFTCKQDVAMFLKYDSNEGVPFDELLVQSYGQNNYTNFSASVEELFNTLIGVGKWSLIVDSPRDELVQIGDVVGRDKEACTAYIPVPCHVTQPCRLMIMLVLAY